MFWSSMLRTEIPMTSGRNSSMQFLMADCVSPSNIRLSKITLWPARRVAAATNAGPSGSGRIFILSVFAEMRRTFIA